MSESALPWLTDFDWSIRMVLSSDKISNLNEPIIILKLDIRDVNGELMEKIIELTLSDTKALLITLNAAREAVRSEQEVK